MYRKKSSIPVSYNDQGYIYFVSRHYRRLPAEERARIRRLCRSAGGEYEKALLEFVTTDNGAEAVCLRHHLSEATLVRAVRQYYIQYANEI